MIRTGMGYDIHRFCDNRKLILGGVPISYHRGLEGHSDADVLLHAICDAILGALGKGDIGEHFPDTDPQYKGISSVQLLEHVLSLAKSSGFKVSQIDASLIAEEPKINSYKEQIRQKVADTLEMLSSDVNVKATTQEGLGAIGQKQGIAAFAVVLLESV